MITLVIKLNYLFESLNKIGLVKRLDALRLWVNTGTVNVTVNGASGNGYTNNRVFAYIRIYMYVYMCVCERESVYG